MARTAKTHHKLLEKEERAKENLRAFRKSSDLEHFYRFIYLHDLRREAHQALKYIILKMTPSKKRSGRGKRAKKLQ